MLDDPDDPTTVMLLKESEWSALAEICQLFMRAAEDRPDLVNVDARAAVARRVIEACE